MKKLPKTIYVQWSGDEPYLEASTKYDASSFEDGAIGVYELKQVKERRTDIHLD